METLKCQLSSLMPVPDACAVLGEDRVKRIVSGISMFQTLQETSSQPLSQKQLQDLEIACNEKADILYQAMTFVPGKLPAKNKLNAAGKKQAMMLMKALDMAIDAESIDEVDDQIPPPIRSSWKSLRTSRSLLLDKVTFLKFFVPSCAQPHSGPGGHMGLFDCLFYALQTKSSSASSSFSPAPISTSSMTTTSSLLVTIPDVIIFFAICQKYWNLQIYSNDPDEIPSFSGDSAAIQTMCQLMFLIYDGYQKSNVVGRDTIHRFMSDVYGDDSYKRKSTKEVLSKIFSNPNSPLTGREFKEAVSQTMSYCPTPSHFLLDWLATLAQAIMPAELEKGAYSQENAGTEPNANDIGKNLPQSAAVLLRKMDQQRRWLPEICEKHFLAEYKLYEIKRRFHSLVESTATVIQGDPMRAAVSEEGGSKNSPNTNARRRSSVGSSTAQPKHVIPITSFLKKVCQPSDEFGHGGYLPQDVAERIFGSVASSSLALGQLDNDPRDMEEKENTQDDESEDATSPLYWDLCHVLQFGGMSLRSRDHDESLVKWILHLFSKSKRRSTVLNRQDLKSMLISLCNHKEFRKHVDRPKWVIADDSEDDQEGVSTSDNTVTASVALELDLVSPSIAHQKADGDSKIPIDELVDYFLMTVESTDNTVTEAQLLKWHKGTKMYGKQRLGPLIIDIRLIAGVLFGVPPKLASLEHMLLMEIAERHKKRYPQTEVSRRGPRGTVWYLVDDTWLKAWAEMIEVVRNTKDDGEDLRDKTSNSSSPRRLGQINNTKLLRENGSLALRADIKWRNDYDLISPLGWSALHAWYDGGPPISRTVVPYYGGTPGAAMPPSRGRQISMQTKNEIELYPFFVTMFLCDASSRGEARPFQQGVPVSRVSPIRMLLVQLCKELDIDPDKGRLWVMEKSDDDANHEGKNDWLLDVDSNLVEQRKNRVGIDQKGTSNINLLLEIKNEETGEWPRGIDGKNWTIKKGDPAAMEVGDGIVGLYNMGNTCYLNSSIQCLSHTPIFRDYFTSKCYLNDINTTNPLGHEGQLAQVSAVLINNIWRRFNQQPAPNQQKRITAPGSYFQVNAPALTPKTFKESLGKFNDHFAGNEQHDAQELLAFLLGGLSEDLNRIQNKPYIEAPDSDGRPDSDLADIWWSNHLKREMSIVVAMFTGQYKSLLRCKACKYESARFEPFSFLQLPLPEDDTVPVSVIFYSNDPGAGVTKYSVRVHHNGTLYDVLISLAKIIHADNEAKSADAIGNEEKCEMENDDKSLKMKDIYANMAQNMAVVDMREGFIFKIAPNFWRLPDLQNKDSGELPLLHVYGLDPLSVGSETVHGAEGDDDEKDDDESEGEKPSCAFLALAQRRSELRSKELIHPLSHRVFGTPLLLRVSDLDGLTGSQIYDTVAQHLKPLVPQGALKFLNDVSSESPAKTADAADSNTGETKTKEEIRHTLEKATSDNEEVSAGSIPRYGFRLRLSSREGRRCAVCPWYECCVGCLIPDDNKTTVVANGDSIAIDWHFAVDVATAGFGTRSNQVDLSTSGKAASLRGRVPGVEIKNHVSCGVGLKKGHGNVVTLEDCLDAFAEEEKIPEAYCSKCKDFQVQTKRMSLWRLPPVVIIQLKRFQFTQHMRRKLRDFVQFPLEGLDLSRIMATDGANQHSKRAENGEDEKEASAEQEDKSSHFNGDDGRGEKLYDLYGVVHHQGALSGGHYVASLKSDIDGQWRLFNDAQVYEIHSRDVVDSSAYILFYIRRDVAGQKLSDFWDVRKRVGEGLSEQEMDDLMKGRSEKCIIS